MLVSFRTELGIIDTDSSNITLVRSSILDRPQKKDLLFVNGVNEGKPIGIEKDELLKVHEYLSNIRENEGRMWENVAVIAKNGR